MYIVLEGCKKNQREMDGGGFKIIGEIYNQIG